MDAGSPSAPTMAVSVCPQRGPGGPPRQGKGRGEGAGAGAASSAASIWAAKTVGIPGWGPSRGAAWLPARAGAAAGAGRV